MLKSIVSIVKHPQNCFWYTVVHNTQYNATIELRLELAFFVLADSFTLLEVEAF